ncbi:MAG: carboxypeptidase-like regulatory domain-containing protein [Coriobacteriales bacterium]|nr:carboxypeptidase-like regulatory domain-containing protein [Coriobacteriales bacterium]
MSKDAPVSEPTLHCPEILLSRRRVEETDEGARLVLIVRVSCPHFCNLTGTTVLVTDNEGGELELPLASFNGVENETDEFIVATGSRGGTYSWTASYLDAGEGRPSHDLVTSTLSFDYRPHATSLAVWGYPAHACAGDSVTLMVGATCSKGCVLEGRRVSVLDEGGRECAEAALGSRPWEGTQALYWGTATFTLGAPRGLQRFDARLGDDAEHGAAACGFSLFVAPQPDCILTIAVCGQGDGAPVVGATVSVHPRVATTDTEGTVVLAACAGSARLDAYAEGYERYHADLLVTGDSTLTVSLVPKPRYEEDF